MAENDLGIGYAMGQNSGGGYGNGACGMYGMEFMWIILLFAIWGRGGWGNQGGDGALTRSDLCQDMNFNNLESAVRGIQQGLCDGFYAQNTTMLNGFNEVTRGLGDLGYKLQDCCCQTQRAIDNVNYNMERNTCNIIQSMNNGFQQLRDDAQQRYISQLELQNNRYFNQLSQLDQTNQIINTLRPVAQPAYLTCSPFQTMFPLQQQGSCGGGCQSNCGNY